MFYIVELSDAGLQLTSYPKLAEDTFRRRLRELALQQHMLGGELSNFFLAFRGERIEVTPTVVVQMSDQQVRAAASFAQPLLPANWPTLRRPAGCSRIGPLPTLPFLS